ncbi:MAG: hypothetical protein R3C68_13480 [Myxococcota bacterium]
MPNLGEWLGAFRETANNVKRVVSQIRENPLIPDDVPVHGLVFDPHSGKLELVAQDRAMS